jgi:ATP-binding cassette subfamily F protein 2
LVFQSVSFAYPGCPYLYKNLDFGIDLDSRIALVGPNGVGKTSLLKLMVGQSCPTDGQVSPHNKLRIAWYNQHTVDQLDMELSPLRYMRNLYPEEGEEVVRSWLGRFGVTGASQTQKMRYLSDGQKSRVVFCYMAQQHPHILLLDEPTNHLDMESIDALADAINDFNGGVVLVSHDMRLILQVADELWVCNNKTITRWEGDIISYKQTLLDEIYAQNLLEGDLANI